MKDRQHNVFISKRGGYGVNREPPKHPDVYVARFEGIQQQNAAEIATATALCQEARMACMGARNMIDKAQMAVRRAHDILSRISKRRSETKSKRSAAP